MGVYRRSQPRLTAEKYNNRLKSVRFNNGSILLRSGLMTDDSERIVPDYTTNSRPLNPLTLFFVILESRPKRIGEQSFCSSLHSPCIFPSTRVNYFQLIFSINKLLEKWEFASHPHLSSNRDWIPSCIDVLLIWGLLSPNPQSPQCYRREGKNTCLWILVYSHSIREENEGFFSPLISFKTPSKNITILSKPSRIFSPCFMPSRKGLQKTERVVISGISLLETPVDSLCSLSTLLRYWSSSTITAAFGPFWYTIALSTQVVFIYSAMKRKDLFMNELYGENP